MGFRDAKYQLEEYSVTFTHKDPVKNEQVERNLSLIGLDSEIIIRLALEGAMRRIVKSQNPEAAWELITTNQLDGKGRENYPQVVQAIADIQGVDVKTVYKRWRKMDDEERRPYKQDPKVKQWIMKFKGAEEADMSIFDG